MQHPTHVSPPASNAARASTRALPLASLLFAVVVSGGCEASPVSATEDAATVTDSLVSEDAADTDAVDAPTDARDAAAGEAVVAPDVAPRRPDVADARGPDRCGGACVDLQRDAALCGSCARDCTRLPHLQVGGAACAAGACVVRLGGCLASHGDCDRDPINGCEADLREDEAHCGACGIACPSRHNCYRGMCAPTCVTGDCGGRCVTPRPTR